MQPSSVVQVTCLVTCHCCRQHFSLVIIITLIQIPSIFQLPADQE